MLIASSENPSALGFDVCNQWRELVTISTSSTNCETPGGKFFRDGRADIISDPDHRDRRISVFHKIPPWNSSLVSDSTDGSRLLSEEISNVDAHVVRVYEL